MPRASIWAWVGASQGSVWAEAGSRPGLGALGTRSSPQQAQRQQQLQAEGKAWLREEGGVCWVLECPFRSEGWLAAGAGGLGEPQCGPEAGLSQAQGEDHPRFYSSGVRRKRGRDREDGWEEKAAPEHSEAVKQVFIFINRNVSIHSGQSDSKLQKREPHNPQPGAPLTELQRPKQWHRENSVG